MVSQESRSPRSRKLKPEAGSRAVKPEAVKPEVEPGVVRGLRRVEFSEGPRAPVADVVPERVFEAVEYLVERFGIVLGKEAALRRKAS